MSLSNEYKRQFAWRAWPKIFDALPVLQGQTILDLGCGIGDQSAEIADRGARVIGIDMNEDLLREAQARSLGNAEFRRADLCTLSDLDVAADGLWCSFTAAYFPDLPSVLASWAKLLRPGAWVAMTEIDDLFGHEPLGTRNKELLEAYARDALAMKRYDFHMGRKLRGHLERSGFTVSRVLDLDDQELSFAGPARPEIIEAWRNRFERLKLLRDLCGPNFEQLKEEFLACLARADHRSKAKVYCCMATKC